MNLWGYFLNLFSQSKVFLKLLIICHLQESPSGNSTKYPDLIKKLSPASVLIFAPSIIKKFLSPCNFLKITWFALPNTPILYSVLNYYIEAAWRVDENFYQ